MEIKLNKQQEELANFREGYCLALASAGAGKTATILERTRRMVAEGIDPKEILILTFSRKSVDDLKKKMTKTIKDVNVNNFHSFCIQVLRKHGDKRELTVLWQLNKHFTEKYGDMFQFGEMISWISFQKSHMRKPNDKFVYKETTITENLNELYTRYEKFNKNHNFLDFDDMLLEFIKLANSSPKLRKWFADNYKYIMVDEHQDSSRVQNEILKVITGAGNLVCIGDIKQNIYNFRGSDLSICLDFKSDWEDAKLIQLPTNYRSTKNIVDVSNDFIRPSFQEYDMYEDAGAHSKSFGTITSSNDCDHIVQKVKELVDSGVKYGDIAILYRVNYLGGNYELELREMGIPCTVIEDKPFLERMEIDVIMSYLKLAGDNTDFKSFSSVYNMPNRYLGNAFLKQVSKYSVAKKGDLTSLTAAVTMKPHELRGYKDFCRMVNNIDINSSPSRQIDFILNQTDMIDYIKQKYDDSDEKIKAINLLQKIAGKYKTVKQFLFMIQNINDNKKKDNNAVQLMTVHKSKGLEFKHVIVGNVDSGIFPHKKAPEDEERRLFYVAISRAIDGLYVYGDSLFAKEFYDIVNKDEEDLFEETKKEFDTIVHKAIKGLQDDVKWEDENDLSWGD